MILKEIIMLFLKAYANKWKKIFCDFILFIVENQKFNSYKHYRDIIKTILNLSIIFFG